MLGTCATCPRSRFVASCWTADATVSARDAGPGVPHRPSPPTTRRRRRRLAESRAARPPSIAPRGSEYATMPAGPPAVAGVGERGTVPQSASMFAAAISVCTRVRAPRRRRPPHSEASTISKADRGPSTSALRTDPSRPRVLRDLRRGNVGAAAATPCAASTRASTRQGQILHGTSDTAGEHLGDVLVRYGLISQEDLTAPSLVLRSVPLGAVLVEMASSTGPGARRRRARCARTS